MEVSYINPDEFNKQLTETNLSLEAIAELLEIKISLAEKIFSGHKAISNFRILKLHELAGFNYSNLITKNQTTTPTKQKKTSPLSKNKPILDSEVKKIICEKCDFLIDSPVNYCPNCGTLLPESIRKVKENTPSNNCI